MREPKLYESYGRHEAMNLCGPVSGARVLCDGQWVIFSDIVLCFAEVGGPPRLSHFTCGGEFCWVADKPYRVNDDQHVRFVPPEVVAHHTDRPIRLFVRSRESERYCYVGVLSPACRFSLGRRDNCGEAFFSLSPALPSGVWAELGGFCPGDLDHAAVDAALDRLRHPLTVGDRLDILRRLVGYWHGPIHPEDGIPEGELAGLQIPYPLRWWYRWAGRRPEILSGENKLLGPDLLRVNEDGLLVFYGENQWCYEWATRPEGDDPAVFGRSKDTDPWEPEGIVLSEHLILACLFGGMCQSPYPMFGATLGTACSTKTYD